MLSLFIGTLGSCYHSFFRSSPLILVPLQLRPWAHVSFVDREGDCWWWRCLGYSVFDWCWMLMTCFRSFGGFVVLLTMVCSVLLAPSLALTMFMLILGITGDQVGLLFALATDLWFRLTVAGGFAGGDGVNASFCGRFNLFDNGGASPDL